MMKKIISSVLVMALILCFVPVYFSLAADDTTVGNASSVGSAAASAVYANAKAEIDASNASNGYIKARILNKTEKEVRVTIETSKNKYTYTLKKDTTAEVYPLQMGDGKYTIKVLENTSGTKYAVLINQTIDVKLSDPNAPFLISHQYVNYNSNSKAVAKSNELVKGTTDAFKKVELIYGYIIDNITYDTDKAATVKSGYIPNVDTILSTAKGICFDYATLLCSMLRTQGIPTKMVFGYVAPDSLYHAWNEVFINGTGWVKIGGETYFDGKTWSRMDPTFAATGGSSAAKFIGNGTNYSQAKYEY